MVGAALQFLSRQRGGPLAVVQLKAPCVAPNCKQKALDSLLTIQDHLKGGGRLHGHVFVTVVISGSVDQTAKMTLPGRVPGQSP